MDVKAIKKDKRKISTKDADFVSTFCSVVSSIDLDSSRNIGIWYIQKYGDSDRLNLMNTLLLWKPEHAVNPFISDFNLKILKKANNALIHLYLPQLIYSAKLNRDLSVLVHILKRCSRDSSLSVYFFWMIMVEIEKELYKEQKHQTTDESFFERVIIKFMEEMSLTDNGLVWRDDLKHQGKTVEKLVKISMKIKSCKGGITEKRRTLQVLLEEDSYFSGHQNGDFNLPVKSSIRLTKIKSDKCTVFQSQMSPLLLVFETVDGDELATIFKSGDDLRQDFAICQTLSIAKCILEESGFNPEMIIYDISPTGLQHGFVEFVKSTSFDSIISKGTLYQQFYSQEKAALDNDKMKLYVRSLASFTVISYILCVGDRHLDNILLSDCGRTFHIDFGFIGREPKPFSPLMKICPEMVDIMGGKTSGYYADFMEDCCKCYDILRKRCTDFTVALEIMAEEDSIADIKIGTIEKIKERLRLGHSDREARTLLMNEISKAHENVMPKVLDRFHRTWKQWGDLSQNPAIAGITNLFGTTPPP